MIDSITCATCLISSHVMSIARGTLSESEFTATSEPKVSELSPETALRAGRALGAIPGKDSAQR
jgi:hypothetical protein